MKKKKVLVTSIVLSCVFASAAHLEWVGYKYFDRENGKNPLCVVDPGCRHLTADEIMLAEKYFGQRINYKSVKIFDRPFLSIFGHNYNAVTPNGNIYMSDPAERRTNFVSQYDGYGQRIYMHEMTHVAQHQKGMNVPKMALRELVRHAFDYRASYHYSLASNVVYGEMNLEQQAEMMEDYSSLRSEFEKQTTFTGADTFTFRSNPHGQEWLQARCNELAPYEQKLHKYFPIIPDSLCPIPDTPLSRKLTAS